MILFDEDRGYALESTRFDHPVVEVPIKLPRRLQQTEKSDRRSTLNRTSDIGTVVGTVPGAVATVAIEPTLQGARSLPLPVLYQCCLVRVRYFSRIILP